MKLVLAIMMSASLAAAAPTAVPDGGRTVFAVSAVGSLRLDSDGPNVSKAELLGVTEGPVTQAWRMTTIRQPAETWKFQLRGSGAAPVKRGDTLWARFFLRSTMSLNETGEGHATFVFETADSRHAKSIDLTVSAGSEWREYCFPFVCRDDMAAGESQISLRAGFRPQVIEVGGIEVLNFGPGIKPSSLPRTRVDYPGREADAPWRKQAAERIEKFRKGDFTVKLAGPDGRPLAGADVRVRLRRHAFGFGSAIDGSLLLGTGPDAEKYRETVDRCFSRVVYENELKWQVWESASEARRAVSMKSMDWCAERGIAMRAHVLLWPSWQYLPGSMRQLRDRPDELRGRSLDRVRDMVALTRGRFHDWDVINEPYAHNDLMKVLGDGIMLDWFKAAHQADPRVKLFLNDYAGLAAGGMDTRHKQHFEKTARYLIQQGAPIHGIGLQCHFGWSVTPPELALKELDRWAALGLEIHLTEFDIDTTDEQLQADYTRDLLTLAFSHPAVTAIMTWGFWEGRHWRPDAALLRKDWSLKPNGKAWLDLTTKEWWTDVAIRTGADGTLRFRGFPGDYEIHLKSGGILPVRLDKEHPSASAATGGEARGSIPDEERAQPANSDARPNIIVMVADDHRFDALGVVQRELGEKANFPFLRTPHLDRLAGGGIRFRNAFVTHSLCSPSRATLLTGLYTHQHGIIHNEQPFVSKETWPHMLAANGWTTGYFGKWHMGNQRERPGFQQTATFVNQGIYQNCGFVVNGRDTPSEGWVDDVSTTYAIDFIRREAKRPFALYLGFKAPHDKRTPPARHARTYADETLRKPSNWNQPAPWVRNAGWDWEQRTKDRIAYFQTISGVDDNIGRILDALDELGLAENTMVLYMGDNGYYLGEHGLGDKRTAYEESIRIPFLLRYPRSCKPGVRDHMVLNLDVCATILDACGLKPTWEHHGASLMPLLAEDHSGVPWRDSFFYQNYRDPAYPEVTFDVLAVRTATRKLVVHPGHPEWTQLFDLGGDPTEVRNLADDPQNAPLLRSMEDLLEKHRQQSGLAPPAR